jgi:hypothetical protein
MGRPAVAMVGLRVGRLTVLRRLDGPRGQGYEAKWVCRCECGREISRSGTKLRRAKEASCGRPGCRRLPYIDLTGEKFGLLTVESRVQRPGEMAWNCTCECGGQIVVLGSTLRQDSPLRSCGKCPRPCLDCGKPVPHKRWSQGKRRCTGCARNGTKLIIRGKRFGRLVVLRRVRSQRGKGTMWLVRCDCGREVEKDGSEMQGGRTGSCGFCSVGKYPVKEPGICPVCEKPVPPSKGVRRRIFCSTVCVRKAHS